MAVALQAAGELGAESIMITGFDGYSIQNEKEQLLSVENQQIIDNFLKLAIPVVSLTDTRYKNIPRQSLYTILNQKHL